MEIERLIVVMHGEMKRAAIQDVLDLRHRDYFNEAYLIPALNAGYVEMTIPDKPICWNFFIQKSLQIQGAISPIQRPPPPPTMNSTRTQNNLKRL